MNAKQGWVTQQCSPQRVSLCPHVLNMYIQSLPLVETGKDPYRGHILDIYSQNLHHFCTKGFRTLWVTNWHLLCYPSDVKNLIIKEWHHVIHLRIIELICFLSRLLILIAKLERGHYYCVASCQGHVSLLEGELRMMCHCDWIPAPQNRDIHVQNAQTHGNYNINRDLDQGFLKLLEVFFLWDFCQTGNLCDHQNNDHLDICWILCYGQGICCFDIVLVDKNDDIEREGWTDCIGSSVTL